MMNGSKPCGPSGGLRAPSPGRRRSRLRVSCSPSPQLSLSGEYVFSVRRGVVARICNLLYRRFVIGRASESSSHLTLAAVQNAILRYRRLQICATRPPWSLNTHGACPALAREQGPGSDPVDWP